MRQCSTSHFVLQKERKLQNKTREAHEKSEKKHKKVAKKLAQNAEMVYNHRADIRQSNQKPNQHTTMNIDNNIDNNTDNNTAIITRATWDKIKEMLSAYEKLREERRSILIGKKNQALIDCDECRAKELIRTIETFDERNPATCEIRYILCHHWETYREENTIDHQEENA